MAPKRRCDAVAREIAKTYTFGRSQIDKTDVESLVKNRMVGAGRAPGRETVPRPVTAPPKIIPYYRLSRSTWPLSNNKELLSRFRRVKPGKSHTTGSLICAKPTRRRDQSTTLHYITLKSTSSTLLQTRFFVHKSKHDQSLNSGNKTST
jgi:hypothetical protein